MRRLALVLFVFLAFALPSRGQTFALVNHADSGAQSGSTPIATVSTGSFSLTAGNLLACVFSNSYSGGSANWLANVSVKDTAGNSFVWAGAGLMGIDLNNYWSGAFYSITQAGNASDMVTVAQTTSAPYDSLTCAQYSVSGYYFVTDQNISPVSVASNCTTITTGAFTTNSAIELILGLWTGYGGGTYSAGNIGGTAATLNAVNGSNGTTAVAAIESLSTSMIQSGITAAGAQTAASAKCAMFALSFSATQAKPSGPMFVGSTYVSGGGSSAASITSPSISIPSGALVYVHCTDNAGTAITGFTVTSSPTNTWNKLTLRSSVGALYVQDSYAMNAGSGSTTFTCTPNTSVADQSMVVLVYTGLVTSAALDTQTGGAATSTYHITSPSFSTSKNIEMIVYCAGAPGSGAISYNSPWTAGSIGAATAVLRQVSGPTAETQQSTIAPDGCEDVVTATKQTTITAAISADSGGSGTLAATLAAFEAPFGVARHARDHGWR